MMKGMGLLVIMLGGVMLIITNVIPQQRREFSSTIHEDAVITEVVATPSRHDGGAGLQVNSIIVLDKFVVVLKCQHGQFIIDQKELFEKLMDHTGETVVVSYREVYSGKYTWNYQSGGYRAITRNLVDIEILDVSLN